MKIQWSDRRHRAGIIASIAIFIAIAVWVMWPYQNPVMYKLSPQSAKPSESQQLLAMNKEVISQAASFDTQSIPTISAKDEFVGSLKAPIKVVVYENYASTFSASFASTTERLIKKYGDKIVVAFRPYFLASEPLSRDTALAAVCASKQGRFQEMRSVLLGDAVSDSLSASNFSDYAKKAELNQKKFASCLKDESVAKALEKSVDDARLADVFGAPTVFVNDRLIPGAIPWDNYNDSEGRPNEGLDNIVAKELK